MSDSSLFIYSVALSVTAHVAVIAAAGGAFQGSSPSMGLSVIDVKIVPGGEQTAKRFESPQIDPDISKESLPLRRVVSRATTKSQPSKLAMPTRTEASSLSAASGNVKVISAPLPSYPWAARRAGFEGGVELDVLVDETGMVRDAEITKSSGRSDCDESAIDTVNRHWLFEPAMIAGVATSFRQKILVRYVLE